MKYIAIKRLDGGVSIMGMLPQSINKTPINRIMDRGSFKDFYHENDLVASLPKQDFEQGNYPVEWEVNFPDVEVEIEKWAPEQRDAVVSHEPINFSTIPADRTFRNALELTLEGLSTNMTKARDIHREYLRRLREPLLEELDVAYQIADEQGSPQEKAAIIVKKQALRDVTSDPRIDAAATPEELKLVIPTALSNTAARVR